MFELKSSIEYRKSNDKGTKSRHLCHIGTLKTLKLYYRYGSKSEEDDFVIVRVQSSCRYASAFKRHAYIQFINSSQLLCVPWALFLIVQIATIILSWTSFEAPRIVLVRMPLLTRDFAHSWVPRAPKMSRFNACSFVI